MDNIKMQRAIALNNTTKEDLTDEVIDYIHRVANISLMDEYFWDDFILGASMWSITAGYTGAW